MLLALLLDQPSLPIVFPRHPRSLALHLGFVVGYHPPPKPMQIGCLERWFQLNLCLYYGGASVGRGSGKSPGSAARRGALLSRSLSNSVPSPQCSCISQRKLFLFSDSTADCKFMDKRLASEQLIPTQPLSQPIQVKALDNHVIHSCSLHTDHIHVSIDNLYYAHLSNCSVAW